MTCYFCNQPSVNNVQPPLCEKHLDLAILVERLDDLGQAVTVESVQALLNRGIANNGSLSITARDITALLPGYLARRPQLRRVTYKS